VYAKTGQFDLAIADYNQAKQLKPDYNIYYERGLAYEKKGDFDQAIADFNEAIEQPFPAPGIKVLTPPYALRGDAYCQRGWIYSYRAMKDKAIADLRECVRLSIDPELKRQAEERLKTLESD
jgi:tetratricopeptide (TPR) repeat protein